MRRRRCKVADLVEDGFSVDQTAAALGVSRATIGRDLRALRGQDRKLAALRRPPLDRTGSALAVARVAAGMTQTALAAAAGTSRRVISHAEAGTPIHLDAIARIARVLGVPQSSLFPATEPRGAVRAPAVDSDDGDPVWVRRRAVADLLAEDMPPGGIAHRLNMSRATVYRDIDALRAAAWDVPPRPMGRPPGRQRNT
jgi:transcriptional regulator with XRE-family HTH domain